MSGRWPWIIVGASVVALAGAASLAAVVIFWPAGKRAGIEARTPNIAEDRSDPKGDAEKIVAAWVKKNSPDDANVEFLRWGPHLRREEVVAWLREAGVKTDGKDELGADVIVRVCYRHLGPKRPGAKDREIETLDWLVPIGGQPAAVTVPLGDPNVHFVLANEDQDGWKNVRRQKIVTAQLRLRGR